jgi:hypothetical protein
MVDYALFIRQCPPEAVQLEEDFGVFGETETKPCYCGNPSCTIGQTVETKTDKTPGKLKPEDHEVHQAYVPEEDQALLCPGKVKGFALTDKVWAEFRVDRLTDIEWNSTAYARLEMDKNIKHVIGALVESHRKHSKVDSPEFDDIIAGKGLGLVFLLQGPPGLGKTLTAGKYEIESSLYYLIDPEHRERRRTFPQGIVRCHER